jgi:3-oxoacyl-[acyl-carrier protein] reductase
LRVRRRNLAEEVAVAEYRTPIVLSADLTEPTAVSQLAAEAIATVGQVDVLVNNAGRFRPLSRPER